MHCGTQVIGGVGSAINSACSHQVLDGSHQQVVPLQTSDGLHKRFACPLRRPKGAGIQLGASAVRFQEGLQGGVLYEGLASWRQYSLAPQRWILDEVQIEDGTQGK